MTDARTDGELLAAHLTGDSGAFEALARRHAALVLGVTRRLLGPGPDAEDAAQATFMLLVRKARKLSGARELGAWLHRSARLVALTALRARGRRARHERQAAAMRLASEEPRESKALMDGYADRMDEALDSLPESCRQAVVLCYFEGLSLGEAAQRLAVPESTLSDRCTRGLEKLRARLGAGPRSFGAAALGALLVEGAAEAAGSVPENFVPSVVSAANGAAASASILALTEGALKAMFWTKMKVVAAAVAATVLVAVAAPFAVQAAAGDASGVKGGKPVKKAVANEAVPVDGLKLTLSLAPDRIACGAACAKKAAGRWVRCTTAGCFGTTSTGKHCWDCAVNKHLCEVCGKKVLAGATEIKSLEAGDRVRLALTFENVSKKKMNLCTYLLGMRQVRWQITGPDAASVKSVPSGMLFSLAAISKRDFRELAPGEKRTVGIYVQGNPPGIGYGAMRTCLLKAGLYQVVAAYTNRQDSYRDSRVRKQVRVGDVWKNTLKSQVLQFKISGAVKALPVFKGPIPEVSL